MNIFSSIANFYRLSVEEKEISQNEMSQENTRRTFYLSIIAIPVSIIHIVLFTLKLKAVSGIEHHWVVSIIFSHITILILTTLSSVLLFIFFYRSKKNNLISKITTNVVLFSFLVMGGLIASFDQNVTSAITPFLNSTLIVGLFFLIRPLFSTIYFIASYLIFYVAISQTQMNQEILISNQANGLSITAVGLC
ncbi:MAG: hypothetical protein Q8T08_24645 [Ignavibacteria bacterium]|nr:hypothetical protein [Ignavibacteria bacterium]